MKISSKIALIIAINAIFFFGLGVFAYFSLNKIEAAKNGIVENANANYHQMFSDMMHDAIRGDVYMAMLTDLNDQEAVASVRKSLDEHSNEFRDRLKKIEECKVNDKIKSSVAAVRAPLESYIQLSNELSNEVLSGDSTKMVDARGRLKDYDVTFERLAVVMETLGTEISEDSERLRVEASSTFNQTLNLTYISIVVVLLITIVFGIFLMRSITKPIGEVNRVINSVAQGNLKEEVSMNMTGEMADLNKSLNVMRHNLIANDEEVKRRDEVNDEIGRIINKMSQGDLSERFNINTKEELKATGKLLNAALDNLSKVLDNITKVSNLVASSSEELLAKGEQMQVSTMEVASAIKQIAEGTSQQAQQTDESSKLIEGVLRSSVEMGKKAEYINAAAERGQKSSTEGLVTIQRVVENMGQIQSSATTTANSISILTQRSEEIANTLTVITDIASQTNLLALNAAIEAARAGEAGRGFAVVAEEIRKLAEDSRKSAVDIERVIREVQKDISVAEKSIESMDVSVKNGNSASKEAENVFRSTEKSSGETLNLSKEIVNYTIEQKEAINTTVKNIEKIVVVSEETATGTEQVATSSSDLSQGMMEVTATSKDMADVANQLRESLSKFKLK